MRVTHVDVRHDFVVAEVKALLDAVIHHPRIVPRLKGKIMYITCEIVAFTEWIAADLSFHEACAALLAVPAYTR